MKTTFPTPTTIITATVALLLGIWIGRSNAFFSVAERSQHGPSLAVDARHPSGSERRDSQSDEAAMKEKQALETEFFRVNKMPLNLERSMELNVLFKAWGRKDPRSALAQAWKMGTASDRYIAFSAITEGWSETDFPGSLSYVQALPAGPERSHSLLGLMKKWGASNPASASAYLLKQGNAADIELLGPNLLAGWGESSVTDALKWVNDLNLGGAKTKLYAGLAESWAQKDPKAAMDYFNSQLGMSEAESVVLNRWAIDDPQSAAQYLNTMPERLAEGYIFHFAHHWSAQDPEGAVRWATSLPDKINRDLAVSATMRNLQHVDPEAAARITANYIVDYSESTYVYTDTAAEWTKRDAQKAAAWVDSINDNFYKSKAADGLIPAWAKQDPRAAAEWLLARQGQVQSGLMEQVIEAWGNIYPQKAWDYISQAQITDPAVKFRSMAKAIDQVFVVDPARASELMNQLPTVEYSAKYFKDFAYRWSNYDPKSAARWINELPSNHPYRTEILQGYNGSIYDGARNVEVTKDY